jgi:hypothetical protein
MTALVIMILVVFIIGFYFAYIRQKKANEILSSFVLFVFTLNVDSGLYNQMQQLSLKTLNRHTCLLHHYFKRVCDKKSFSFLEFIFSAINKISDKSKQNLCQKIIKSEMSLAGPIIWAEICAQCVIQSSIDAELKSTEFLFGIIREASENQRDSFWAQFYVRAENLCVRDVDWLRCRSWMNIVKKECNFLP